MRPRGAGSRDKLNSDCPTLDCTKTLDWLEAILARTAESHRQVVGVVADAGVGKSRLCLEFVDRCRARGVAVHGPSPLRNGAAAADTRALGQRARPRRRRACGGGAAQGRGTTVGLGGGFRDFLPIVLEVLGVAEPGKPVGASFPNRLADFLRRIVRATIPREPVVVLLDDAHWIDRASDELVRAHHRESSGIRFEAARWQHRAALHASNIKLKVKRSLVRSLFDGRGFEDQTCTHRSQVPRRLQPVRPLPCYGRLFGTEKIDLLQRGLPVDSP